MLRFKTLRHTISKGWEYFSTLFFKAKFTNLSAALNQLPMKLKFTYLFVFISCYILEAQNFSDALRYSQTLVSGTARTVSVGAAYSSLGADFSVLSINPAGLATYRRSEIVVTPSLFFGTDKTSFVEGMSAEDKSNLKFHVDNIGFVRVGRRNPASSWKTSNFAVGINRIAEFDEKFSYSGSSQGTITDRWIAESNGVAPEALDDFELGPAFDAEAIYDWSDTEMNYLRDLFATDIIDKNQTVERDGGIYEVALGWAGNYNEKFSLGLGVGVPILAYEEVKNYQELDNGDLIPVFNALRFQENLAVSGVGVNFKLGTIIHPNRKIRLGLSAESPTFYSITEDFSTIVGYSYELDDEMFTRNESSPDGTYSYSLRTPWKANVGLSYLFTLNDINGFISAAADYKNYGGAKFGFSDDSQGERMENEAIAFQLGSAINYHVGGEFAIKKFRVRAGLIMEGSPFEVDTNEFNNIYSTGIGYRGKRFFIDTAFRLNTGTEGYSPYLVDPSNGVSQNVIIDKNFNKFLLTFGYKL